MKPLLIFQIHESMNAEKAKKLTEIIKNGIDNGCLIVDDSITILSFDKNGNLDYFTPSGNHIAIK